MRHIQLIHILVYIYHLMLIQCSNYIQLIWKYFHSHSHHRKYIPNTDPWDYPDNLLVTLCENCHEIERESRPEYEKLLVEQLRVNFFADDLRRLALGFSELKLLHAPEVVASVYEWALSSPEIQGELIDRFFLDMKAKLKAKKR